MKVNTAIYLMANIFASEERHVLLLLGAPGLGKTAAVSEAVRRAGLEQMTLALPTCDAVDLRGLPRVENGRTCWASPMPTSERGVLLLDELTSAPRDVQVAAHHIVWSEAGSDMNLPKGWHVVLTGNRASDKSIYQSIGAPLRNRMTIIEIEPDSKVWCDWAVNTDINPLVVGFIRWRPELLVSREIPGEGAFPSPRSWHNASRYLGMGTTADVEKEILVGTIGEGPATEFAAYLRTARDLPQVNAIMDDPENAPVSTSPSICYAVTSLLSNFTRQSLKSAMAYVKRLPAEYGVLYLTDIRDKFDLKSDPEIRFWVGQHKRLFQW